MKLCHSCGKKNNPDHAGRCRSCFVVLIYSPDETKRILSKDGK